MHRISRNAPNRPISIRPLALLVSKVDELRGCPIGHTAPATHVAWLQPASAGVTQTARLHASLASVRRKQSGGPSHGQAAQPAGVAGAVPVQPAPPPVPCRLLLGSSAQPLTRMPAPAAFRGVHTSDRRAGRAHVGGKHEPCSLPKPGWLNPASSRGLPASTVSMVLSAARSPGSGQPGPGRSPSPGGRGPAAVAGPRPGCRCGSALRASRPAAAARWRWARGSAGSPASRWTAVASPAPAGRYR